MAALAVQFVLGGLAAAVPSRHHYHRTYCKTCLRLQICSLNQL